MDINQYIIQFQQAADQLDKGVFDERQIETAVGTLSESIFLKLFKKSWSTPGQDPLTAKSRIFFSVWVTEQGIKQQKLFYNIHAFKLRKLQGYLIESRKFAEMFRTKFSPHMNAWPNVRVNFGPLTLMEGWVRINQHDLVDTILILANKFLEIEHLIDYTLTSFRRVY